jgi:magnesium transporter
MTYQPGSSDQIEHVHKLESAGHLAVRSFPSAAATEKVGAVLDRIRSSSLGMTDLLLVTDQHGAYQGVVELIRLLRAPESTEVAALTTREWPSVAPDLDQEHVIEIADEAKVAALPVIRSDGKPLGVIPPFVLLDVVAREHRKDMHRMVGILRERAGSRHALEDPPFKRAAQRLPWLLVGLALSAAATGVMAGFESALQANVTIAFFIPALVYLTDAIGTQTEAIAIRGLSARRRPLPTIFLLELVTGGIIGTAIAVVAFFGVWMAFGDLVLGAGVAASLLLAGTLASSLGLVLPWSLARMGIDPAFGTGPVATIVQDVLTILIYFTIMTALV